MMPSRLTALVHYVEFFVGLYRVTNARAFSFYSLNEIYLFLDVTFVLQARTALSMATPCSSGGLSVAGLCCNLCITQSRHRLSPSNSTQDGELRLQNSFPSQSESEARQWELRLQNSFSSQSQRKVKLDNQSYDYRSLQFCNWKMKPDNSLHS